MQIVKDATGREWPVAITVAGLERVKDGTGFDLCSLIKGEPLEDFYHDLTLAVRVGYWLCQPIAETKKITRNDFAEGFSGDSIEALQVAILDELPRFFPRQRGELLSAMIAKFRTELTAALEKVSAEISSPGVGSSGGSSASIPASSPTDV